MSAWNYALGGDCGAETSDWRLAERYGCRVQVVAAKELLMQRVLAALAALVLMLSACGGDAEPTQSLTVMVEHPDRATLEYQVTCDGSDASVTPDTVGVDAAAACETLENSDAVTRLVAGPPEDLMCAAVFGGSDVATVTGTIDDQTVDARISRTDGCGVSDWDELLGGLLPPPVT